jgi:uncharacterized C2H2 Zn-finger protein
MSDETFKIPIPIDNEGFYSQECPHCHFWFKREPVENEEDYFELTCPSCGIISSKSHFFTKKVIEHAEVLAMNEAKKILNNTFKKMSRKMKGSPITFKFKKLEEELLPILMEDDQLEPYYLNCCDTTIKINRADTTGVVHCPFCGGI